MNPNKPTDLMLKVHVCSSESYYEMRHVITLGMDIHVVSVEF